MTGAYTVAVGFTVSRPVVPDECVSYVLVQADGPTAATLLAAQIVATRPGVEMPTSTRIVSQVV